MAATLSLACSKNSVVIVRPIPADAIRPVERGDTLAIAPGAAFVGDSYAVEIPRARAARSREDLHPIDGRDFIYNDTRDTIVAVAPKRGWIASALYLVEVWRVRMKATKEKLDHPPK